MQSYQIYQLVVASLMLLTVLGALVMGVKFGIRGDLIMRFQGDVVAIAEASKQICDIAKRHNARVLSGENHRITIKNPSAELVKELGELSFDKNKVSVEIEFHET